MLSTKYRFFDLIPRVADSDLSHVSERVTRQKRRSVSGKRRNAAGNARESTEGGEKFVTGVVARALWYVHHGANRSYPVTKFSPVKQVNINVPRY